MWNWMKSLDGILRGDVTRPSRLRDGQIAVPLVGLAILCVILGATYGFCMGWFALFNRETPQYMQVVAAMVKVPALFLLTLLVTLPSLYVFNALAGSRISGVNLLRLLIASLALTLAVLASLGPIVAFFSITTSSYGFILLFNVSLFAAAGALGLGFLLQTMHRLNPPDRSVPPPVPGTSVVSGPHSNNPTADEPVSALDRVPGRPAGRNVRAVFVCWVIVFGLVGAQMSWVLRPFIGAPDRPFEWFRPRESNFFEAVKRTAAGLFQ